VAKHLRDHLGGTPPVINTLVAEWRKGVQQGMREVGFGPGYSQSPGGLAGSQGSPNSVVNTKLVSRHAVSGPVAVRLLSGVESEVQCPAGASIGTKRLDFDVLGSVTTSAPSTRDSVPRTRKVCRLTSTAAH